jgi:hypothetical protein
MAIDATEKMMSRYGRKESGSFYETGFVEYLSPFSLNSR